MERVKRHRRLLVVVAVLNIAYSLSGECGCSCRTSARLRVALLPCMVMSPLSTITMSRRSHRARWHPTSAGDTVRNCDIGMTQGIRGFDDRPAVGTLWVFVFGLIFMAWAWHRSRGRNDLTGRTVVESWIPHNGVSALPKTPGRVVKRLADELGKRGSVSRSSNRQDSTCSSAGPVFSRTFPRASGETRVPFYCARFQVLALVRSGGCDLLHANWSLTGWFAWSLASSRRKVLLTERSPFLIETNKPYGEWIRSIGHSELRSGSHVERASEGEPRAQFPEIISGWFRRRG